MNIRIIRTSILIVQIISLGFVVFSNMRNMGYEFDERSGITHVAGSSNLLGLIWGMIFILIYVFLQKRNVRTKVIGIPSRFRRMVAFLIDFYFVSIPIAAIVGFIGIYFESLRTGQFKWSFVRDYAVLSDWILVPVILASMVLIVFYFANPLIKGAPNTFGYYLMGLAVADEQGEIVRHPITFSVKRSFYKMFGIIYSLYGLTYGKDSLGRLWHDMKMNTRVVLCEFEEV